MDEKDESLVPTVHPLYKESGDLVNQIINETDTDKIDDLTKLFTINQRKKDIARIDKLSQLLNLVDDEVTNRLVDCPESFNNDQLVKYMTATQQSISTIENTLDQKPIIQINNQKNEIHINDSGLNRESREKVLNAVMEILNKANDNVIDVDVEEND